MNCLSSYTKAVTLLNSVNNIAIKMQLSISIDENSIASIQLPAVSTAEEEKNIFSKIAAMMVAIIIPTA